MDRLPPFLRFAIIGALGFLLDLAVLAFAIEVLGLGPYAGRALLRPPPTQPHVG